MIHQKTASKKSGRESTFWTMGTTLNLQNRFMSSALKCSRESRNNNSHALSCDRPYQLKVSHFWHSTIAVQLVFWLNAARIDIGTWIRSIKFNQRKSRYRYYSTNLTCTDRTGTKQFQYYVIEGNYWDCSQRALTLFMPNVIVFLNTFGTVQ